MDTKKEAKKYLNKYFKAQYIKETDEEYKALVRLLNKALSMNNVSNMLCGSFDPDTTTSSETKCKCGREKWEHPKAT